VIPSIYNITSFITSIYGDGIDASTSASAIYQTPASIEWWPLHPHYYQLVIGYYDPYLISTAITYKADQLVSNVTAPYGSLPGTYVIDLAANPTVESGSITITPVP
jgi:hypothetical protein